MESAAAQSSFSRLSQPQSGRGNGPEGRLLRRATLGVAVGSGQGSLQFPHPRRAFTLHASSGLPLPVPRSVTPSATASLAVVRLTESPGHLASNVIAPTARPGRRSRTRACRGPENGQAVAARESPHRPAFPPTFPEGQGWGSVNGPVPRLTLDEVPPFYDTPPPREQRPACDSHHSRS